ncbi:MAG: AAA family ATPase [Pirellulales bacterium]|nr:AAA family ATPase [Pirellulales bacterium]
MSVKIKEELLEAPEHTYDSERTLLAAVILEPDHAKQTEIVRQFRAEWFYHCDYKIVASRLIGMVSRGAGIDQALLVQELKASGISDAALVVGGIYRQAANTHLWQEHLATVKDAHIRFERHYKLKRMLLDNKTGLALDEASLDISTITFRTASQAKVICMNDVQPESITWLWPQRIACGKVTLISGDPGLGKSFVSLDLATRVTLGTPWPDAPSSSAPRGSVLVLNAEDDAADTIRPRLDAMGADVGQIHLLDAIRTGEQERHFCLLHDLDILEQAAGQLGDCRLIIIDPISSYLVGVKQNDSGEIRQALDPLKGLAQRTGAAVVLIAHLNKSGGANALYRTSGSISIIGMARTAWVVTKDPEDQTNRLILPMKSNLAAEVFGLGFKIIDSQVAWGTEPVKCTADDALERRPSRGRPGKASEEAKSFLREALQFGPQESSELEAMAEARGISQRTLWRVKGDLEIVSERIGGRNGKWLWKLPGIEF